jgi:tetratricopeptide (TPR) repeat protein
MRTLTRYCLVESHHQTESYHLHVCVHDWTLDGLNHDIDSNQYWLAFDCVADHVRLDDWDNLSALRYRRLTPHAVRLAHERFQPVGCQQEWLQTKHTRAGLISQLLKQQIQYKAAERMHLRALAGYEKALGPDHTSTLITIISMGTLLCLQDQLSEAENMYQHALSGAKRALGPDHIRVLGTVNNLANLYCEQGKSFKTRGMYEQALGGTTRSLGPDHSFISGMINNRGLLYAEEGELDAAQQMYQQARDGFQRSLGSKHPYTQMVCYNIEQLGLTGARAGVPIISNAGQKNGVNRPRRRWYY